MHVGRSADPNNVEIGQREEIGPVRHRRRALAILLAELFAAFVGRVRDGDNVDVGGLLERGQMPRFYDVPRPDNSDAKFLITFLSHDSM